MRRLGTVVRAAAGLAVVRLSADYDTGGPPADAVGVEALDEQLSTVGTVVDVFGPVDRPYLAVSPTAGVSPASLLGDPVYAR
jgi:RNA-binding protein